MMCLYTNLQLPSSSGSINIIIKSRAKENTVTHMTIAGERLSKRIPEITLSTIEGYPLLRNGPINTHS
jgi:hypothetical protein